MWYLPQSEQRAADLLAVVGSPVLVVSYIGRMLLGNPRLPRRLRRTSETANHIDQPQKLWNILYGQCGKENRNKVFIELCRPLLVLSELHKSRPSVFRWCSPQQANELVDVFEPAPLVDVMAERATQ